MDSEIEVSEDLRYKCLLGDNKDCIYRLYDITENHVSLFNETKNQTGNSKYPKSYFTTDRWEIIPLPNCGECGQRKVIPENDFICKECRDKEMHTGRLIATIQDEALIIQFEGNGEEVRFLTENGTHLVLNRSDLPVPVLEALRTFVQ